MKPAIAWCDALLSRWGRWAIRCNNGALGYAKCSVIAGAGEGESRTDPGPPVGVTEDDYNAITDAVMELPIVIVAVVVQVYQHGAGKSDSQNAKALGISRQALTDYIHRAQRQIARDISLKGNQ